MKKVIIAIAIIAASGVTALSLGKSGDNQTVTKTIKVDKADFIQKGFAAEKSDVSTAD